MSEEIISKKPSKPQASRKGKRAWRKNIDIQEIEQNLQDKRDEEIVLGKLQMILLLMIHLVVNQGNCQRN